MRDEDLLTKVTEDYDSDRMIATGRGAFSRSWPAPGETQEDRTVDRISGCRRAGCG
jgi:hypothetical protein